MTQEKKDATKKQRVTNPSRTQSRPRKATQAKSNENRPAMPTNLQGNTGIRGKQHTQQHALTAQPENQAQPLQTQKRVNKRLLQNPQDLKNEKAYTIDKN